MQNQPREPATSEIIDQIQRVKEGLPVSDIEMLSKKFGVPEDQMASSLKISHETLISRKKEGRFKPDESERVWRFTTLYIRAEEVLGSREKAMQWFHTPKNRLYGMTPFEIADTEPGSQAIRGLLDLLKSVRFSG